MLTFLASFSLIASSTTIVVACTGDQYSIIYKQDNGKLQDILKIDLAKLKTYQNAKELYDDLKELLKDYPDITIEPYSQSYEQNIEKLWIVTKYSITVLDANGKPAIKEDNIDFGESGDRRYIKVEYSKTIVKGELNEDGISFKDGSQVLDTLEDDFATFAIINK